MLWYRLIQCVDSFFFWQTTVAQLARHRLLGYEPCTILQGSSLTERKLMIDKCQKEGERSGGSISIRVERIMNHGPKAVCTESRSGVSDPVYTQNTEVGCK